MWFVMPDVYQLIIYTLENCPNCEVLKEYMGAAGIRYIEKDLSTAESLTELRINGVFVQEAPVLGRDAAAPADTRFFTSSDLFAGGRLQEKKVMELVQGA